MFLEHSLSALLQLHLHSQVNTWLQRIGQRQSQAETSNIYVLGFGATYIGDLTVLVSINFVSPYLHIVNNTWM